MAATDRKISELTLYPAPLQGDIIPIVQVSGSVTKKATVQSLFKNRPVVTVGFVDADFICDGTNDDVQIQAAIDAVEDLGGGTVYIRVGNYGLSTTTITVPSNIMIKGDGWATVLTRATKSVNKIFDFSGGSNGAVMDFKIVNATALTSDSCIAIAMGDHFLGFHMEISGGTDTFYAIGKKDLRISNCYLHDYARHGILMSNLATDFTIEYNRIVSTENDTGAYGTGYRGIYLLQASNGSIVGNYIARHDARGIFVNRASTYIRISNNFFEDNFHHVTIENDTPASLEGASIYNTVVGNVFKKGSFSQSSSVAVKVGYDTADAYPSSFNTIEGNVFLNPSYGISIVSGDGNVVSGNVINTSGDCVRVLPDATNTIVFGNSYITSTTGLADTGVGTRETARGTVTVTSSATPTPNAAITSTYIVSALAAGATFGAPTNTPLDGQRLLIRIKDNGSAQTLAWNAIYRAFAVVLPTTTVISKTLYVLCVYNKTDTKWDVLAVGQEN